MAKSIDMPSSWQRAIQGISSYPSNDNWRDWKALAMRFLEEGVSARLDQYFYARQSMHHFIFTTPETSWGHTEPRVTLAIPVGKIASEMNLQVTYGKSSLHFAQPDLSYVLDFNAAFGTFRRFLNQLWTATMTEPIPAEIRSPPAPFSAPVL